MKTVATHLLTRVLHISWRMFGGLHITVYNARGQHVGTFSINHHSHMRAYLRTMRKLGYVQMRRSKYISDLWVGILPPMV
jgi:hypothetical protein